MIERHKYLPAASVGTIIWHYMSIPSFLYLLNRKQLFFSRVDHLEDKAEILVSDVEKKYWREVLHSDPGPWIERERKRVFINCWIKSNNENSTMWSAYASQGTGVALKSTVERLMNSYEGDTHINILDVNYIDHRIQTVQIPGDVENVLRYFAAKRIFYEAEQELRLIYESPKVDEFESFQIPIDINTLIEELIIGPNVSEDVFEIIKQLIPIKDGTFTVQHSELLY